LDFIFDLVLNTEGKPVGAVSGDFMQAYREGVALARQVFQTELPKRPKDNHSQSNIDFGDRLVFKKK